MNKKTEIRENSIKRVIIRTIGLIISIYLIINFNENPSIYGISLFIISFYLLVKDEVYTIKYDSRGIEISHSNLLKISASKKYIRHSEISNILFIPSKFSFTIFLLNSIIRSGVTPNKDSLLVIHKKNGETIEMKGIGTKEEINILQKQIDTAINTN